MLCLLLTLLCMVLNCHARPNGAPTSACSTLIPVHAGTAVQESNPPYTISAVKSGNKVTVTISSPIGEEIQGFILQARATGDRTKFVEGEFTSSEEARTIDCFKGKKNTLTHKSPAPKKVIETEWKPSDAVSDVVFRATVAKSFSVFWAEIDSSPIKIESDSRPPETDEHSDVHTMYDNCFGSKGCIGLPQGCDRRADCEVLLTYTRTPNGIQFDLHGYLEPSRYMAMGLSNDLIMGEDTVTECIRDGSGVIARESWNEGKSNTRTKELSKDQYSSSFTNGLSTCSWTKPYIFEANGQQYNLSSKRHFVLLAKGDVQNGRLSYHEGRLPFGPVNFTSFEVIEGKGVTDSVKVHGISGESTEFQYTPTVSLATDEHEAKPTSSKIPSAEDHEKGIASCTSQLSIGLLLLVIFNRLYATGNFPIFASSA